MLQTQNWKIETKKCRSHWQPIKIIPYMQSRMLRLYNTQVTTSLFIFITYHSIGYNFQPQSFAWFTLLLYPCWPVNISFSPSSNSCSISYTILCFFFVFFYHTSHALHLDQHICFRYFIDDCDDWDREVLCELYLGVGMVYFFWDTGCVRMWMGIRMRLNWIG